jgi:hypothetical protein
MGRGDSRKRVYIVVDIWINIIFDYLQKIFIEYAYEHFTFHCTCQYFVLLFLTSNREN